MTVMMPLMFTFLSISMPSGLPLYWFVSNLLSTIIQYFSAGWGGLEPTVNRLIEQISGVFSRKTITNIQSRVNITGGQPDTTIVDGSSDKEDDIIDAEDQSIQTREEAEAEKKKRLEKNRSKSKAKKSKRSKRK